MERGLAPSMEVRWYGERGVMNALVTRLQRASDPVESVRTFLSAVRWAGPGGGSWVNDFTQVYLIVEIGLADFGNPDLMIVCHGPAGVRCVFVESKIVMYLASMRPNHKGMQLPGFNSSINGQLSLKYRFARSLHAAASDAMEIAESPAQLGVYKAKQGDSKPLPRRLVKPVILKNILRPLGLLGLPETHCAYVALTWDAPERVFFNDPLVRKHDGLPVFSNEAGDDASAQDRLGWLGYGALDEILNLRDAPEYQAALRTMIDYNVPKPADYSDAVIALGQVSAEAIPLMDRLASLFTGYDVARFEGSFSIKEGGQTIAKLIPRENGVFVGIRDSK